MYIDDIIVISKSHDSLLESLEVVTNLLTSLGLRINWEKTVTIPSRIAKHLGYVINSNLLELNLPADKCTTIEQKCLGVLDSCDKAKIRNVASLVGLLSAHSCATKWGRLYIRDIEKDLNIHLLKNGRNYDEFIKLNLKSLVSIKWWLTSEKSIPRFFG